MKKVCLVLLLLLCACSNALPASESESGDGVDIPEDESSSRVIDTSQTNTTKWLTYHSEEYEFISKDGYTLSLASDAGENRVRIAFRLYSEERNYDQVIAISDYDDFIFYALMERDPKEEVEVDLNTEIRTATLIINKNHYILYFDSLKYTHEICYRRKDLGPEFADRSMDGRYKLYATYITAAGDTAWGDYVIHDTETEDIWYLTDYWSLNSAVFCGTNAVLINRINELELLDMFTGEPLPNAPAFSYGQSEKNENDPFYYTLGIAYDREQKKTLVAYRESGDLTLSHEPDYEVNVAVFDESGARVDTFETGFLMQPYIIVFYNMIEFEFVENGIAVLSTLTTDTVDNSIERIVLGSIEY